MKIIRSVAAALAVACFTALPVFAGDPSGLWKFKAEAQGRSVESTLNLQWQNNRLSGTIDNRAGKAEIKDAKFADEQVSFTVERSFGKRLRKKTFTVHYVGKLEGDTIKGTIETTDRDKQPVSIPWEAHRAK